MLAKMRHFSAPKIVGHEERTQLYFGLPAGFFFSAASQPRALAWTGPPWFMQSPTYCIYSSIDVSSSYTSFNQAPASKVKSSS